MLAVAALTIILAMPSTDGLVACADRQVYNTEHGFNRDYRKLHPAGSTGVFASSGMTGFTHDGVRIFDVRDVIFAGLSTLRLPSPPEAIRDWAKQTIFDPLLASHALELPMPPDIRQPAIQSFLFYLDNGRPTFTAIQIFTAPTNDQQAPSGKVDTYALDKMVWAGVTFVLDELVSGHDSRFDDMRRDRVFSQLLLVEHPPIFSTEKTLTFMRWVIREASRRTTWLNPAPAFAIGDVADCAIITKRGVVWKTAADERRRSRRSD
jgi:hypothetical protein